MSLGHETMLVPLATKEKMAFKCWREYRLNQRNKKSFFAVKNLKSERLILANVFCMPRLAELLQHPLDKGESHLFYKML